MSGFFERLSLRLILSSKTMDIDFIFENDCNSRIQRMFFSDPDQTSCIKGVHVDPFFDSSESFDVLK